MYDIIVVGGGPAGMTAALYARRNGKTALVIEKNGFGGQITSSPNVENYPGTLSMSGNEFAEQTLDQILAQGAEIEVGTVDSIDASSSPMKVATEEGDLFECSAVIIATGVKHRMLGLEGEEDFIGEGISFCAVCDGDFYTDRDVCVAGGGNSALQEAILLAEKCSSVTILQDLPYLTGEPRMQDILKAKDNVKVITDVKFTGILTDGRDFAGVSIERAGTPEDIKCDGLFVAVGLIPENGPFESLAELDGYGYFETGEDCRTRTPGVFVAGDCRKKTVRQLATAIADGASAALAACDYLNGL